jgi:hypothetical protein
VSHLNNGRPDEENSMLEGSCHCGAITFSVPGKPEWLTECNCSICRRIGARWAHFERDEVELSAQPNATIAYVQGDKTLAVHTCKRCGCTPYWLGLDPEAGTRMALNFRMCDPDETLDIPVRHFDGADTWQFLD